MSRARSSSMKEEAPCCWQSEKALATICSLQRNSSGAIAVYVGVTRLANDRRESRFTATQSEIATFSGTSDRTVREWLPVLKELGVIDLRERFEGENRLADEITVVSMAPPEDLSAPPEELGSDCRHNSSELLRRIEESKKKREGTRSNEPISDDTVTTHEAIYQAYPKHVGKQAALKAIAKACKTNKPEHLLERSVAYSKAVSKWLDTDQRFIPYPATWFNEGRYEDDPNEWQRPGDGGNASVTSSSLYGGRAL